MKIDLDDIQTLRNLDASDSLHQLREVPVLLEREAARARDYAASMAPLNELHEIVLCGVGGAAVSGLQQLQAAVADQCPVPVTFTQAYRLPAYVDAHTLVVIGNYSGSSEEVVSAYRHAVERGAQAVVLASGGTAKQIAQDQGHMHYELPKDQGPRFQAEAYFLVPLLLLLARWGLAADPGASIRKTVAAMRKLSLKYSAETPIADNPAKQFAMELDGRIPVIYGTQPYTAALAGRFKRQLAESGKVMAFHNAFSGLNHDEAFGWDADSAIMKQFHFTLIQDSEDNERMAKRLRVTRDVLLERTGVKEIRTSGGSRLERMAGLGYFFDFVSVYVALRRAVNPAWSQAINEFRTAFNQN